MAGEDSTRGKYEFLDHTADVQIHAWGNDLKEVFENAAVAMSAYITDINTIDISEKQLVSVEADDLKELLFRYLDEVLFLFNAEPYLVTREVQIINFQTSPTYAITAECRGETFSLDKHPQGTEIKAITYSAMKICNNPDNHEVYFIVDI